MNKLIIDNKAISFIKKTLARENTESVRVFVSGGGCCKRFEIAPVKKPLSGDSTYRQDGIIVHIEKYLVDNSSTIEIRFEENKGLVINLY
ncbi:MAG: hypothetical protein FIB08_08150 [Candidatus Methanoperedens sp.]|nr:hypothetical protein [Candidatus Methanoperedens sp.]